MKAPPAVDFDRLARERFERVQAAMAALGVDLLLLARFASAAAVSGARRVQVAGSGGLVPWVMVRAGDERPIVYTTDPDGVPPWLEGRSRPLRWDAAKLVAEVGALAGPRCRRLAIDAFSPRLRAMLAEALPGVDWLDAEEVLRAAAFGETASERACRDHAAAIAASALERVAAALRSGAPLADVPALWLAAAADEGATFVGGEPRLEPTADGSGASISAAVWWRGQRGEAARSVVAGRRAAPAAPPDAPLELARLAKARAAMERAGPDALLLLKSANVRWATGARAPHADPVGEAAAPIGAVVLADRFPLLFTSDPGGVGVRPERIEAAFPLDDAAGAGRFARLLRDAVGSARRIAVDRLTVPLLAAIRAELPAADILDADTVLAPAKMVKLPAEVDRLREAQRRNERAIARVVERLCCGVREIDLTGAFHRGLAEAGVSAVHVESVWCALPKTRAEAPWTFPGSLPYRELTGGRVLGESDLVAADTGVLFEGYASDFGRTWTCGRSPSAAEHDLFRRWCEVRDRLVEACRPGRTALDLRRAALRGWTFPEPPWPAPLYVAHSLGVGGVEPPFVGTDLGEAAEERWALEPGMVIVLEPYVWEDGVGGYRAEETLVVTEGGNERLTTFPYAPFEE